MCLTRTINTLPSRYGFRPLAALSNEDDLSALNNAFNGIGGQVLNYCVWKRSIAPQTTKG
jgi:hypothetical protein